MVRYLAAQHFLTCCGDLRISTPVLVGGHAAESLSKAGWMILADPADLSREEQRTAEIEAVRSSEAHRYRPRNGWWA